MKCYKHYNNDASSQCSDCGKGLCPECTNKYEPPLCDSCLLNRVRQERFSILIILGLTALIFIGSTYFFFFVLNETNIFIYLWASYIYSTIPIGWTTLSKLQPKFFVWMPIIGWIFYIFIKLALSMPFGIIVTPFKIYKYIKRLVKINNLQKYAKS